MQNEFLIRALTRAPSDGGCGMSTRPEFYSARGATTSDLSSEKLERVYEAVLTHVGKNAAKAFARMVASIRTLSATEFLLTLGRLEANGWRWNRNLLGDGKGIAFDDFGSALCTVVEVLGATRYERRDETVSIRYAFLSARGMRDPLVPKGRSVYNCCGG
jgi:hypothetical protein